MDIIIINYTVIVTPIQKSNTDIKFHSMMLYYVPYIRNYGKSRKTNNKKRPVTLNYVAQSPVFLLITIYSKENTCVPQFIKIYFFFSIPQHVKQMHMTCFRHIPAHYSIHSIAPSIQRA